MTTALEEAARQLMDDWANTRDWTPWPLSTGLVRVQKVLDAMSAETQDRPRCMAAFRDDEEGRASAAAYMAEAERRGFAVRKGRVHDPGNGYSPEFGVYAESPMTPAEHEDLGVWLRANFER